MVGSKGVRWGWDWALVRIWGCVVRVWGDFCSPLSEDSLSFRSFPVFSPPGPPRKPPALSRVSRMFSVAHPAAKVPQPERLDLVYAALKRGLT